MAAYQLDASNPDRQYDLGTALASGGALQAAVPIIHEAHRSGNTSAAYNLGTASLQQGEAELAVVWLREALLAAPHDADVKHNYELALRLLARARAGERDEPSQEQQAPSEQHRPTPTPSVGAGAPTPTPARTTESAIYAALERAEAETRATMQRPTPLPAKVEKDW
jgi:hypothetical protein